MKLGTHGHVADALTKCVSCDGMRMHMTRTNQHMTAAGTSWLRPPSADTALLVDFTRNSSDLSSGPAEAQVLVTAKAVGFDDIPRKLNGIL